MKFFIMAIIILTANIACANVKIDYSESEIYSRAEMDSAIEIIREKFSHWRGCEFKIIRYAGDTCNSAENIKWMNDLAEGQGYEKNFAQCIEFLSDFYVTAAVESGTGFNPDSEYKNWQWWLARTKCGDWKLLTFGY